MDRVRVFPTLPPVQDDEPLRNLLADTLAAVVALQEATAGVLMLVDRERGDLYPAASIHLTDEYLERVGQVQLEVGACGTGDQRRSGKERRASEHGSEGGQPL